jgi:hypothetical protein
MSEYNLRDLITRSHDAYAALAVARVKWHRGEATRLEVVHLHRQARAAKAALLEFIE